jgi:hypothetical protein
VRKKRYVILRLHRHVADELPDLGASADHVVLGEAAQITHELAEAVHRPR